jgi:hypothetical protein
MRARCQSQMWQIRVHRSVKIRVEAEDLKGGKCVPKAKFELEGCEWVD